MPTRPESSLTSAYADRLESRAASRWRKYLGVQLPYRWNLRRLHLGFVLDVGCGVGRNLEHLDGNGIGVDPNADCVDAARQRGLRAYEPHDFERLADKEGGGSTRCSSRTCSSTSATKTVCRSFAVTCAT